MSLTQELMQKKDGNIHNLLTNPMIGGVENDRPSLTGFWVAVEWLPLDLAARLRATLLYLLRFPAAQHQVGCAAGGGLEL